MQNLANNPDRKTWLDVSEDSDFPIQNIPFGVFIPNDDIITTGATIEACANALLGIDNIKISVATMAITD